MASTDYRAENPFEENEQPVIAKAPPVVPAKSSTQQPETSDLFREGPPVPKKGNTSSFNPGSNTGADDLDRKEMELTRRKEDIERREKQLKDKEAQLNVKTRQKNWPKCKPFLYHDISVEIPTPELQSLLRKAYFGWFVIVIAYLWNVIVDMAVLIVSGSGGAIEGFVLGIVFALFSIPVSFLVYRTLYNAAKTTSSARYVLYFCLLWTEIAIFILLAVGVSGWGSGGFLVMLDMFNADQKTVGVFCVVVFLLFVFLVVYHIVVFGFARREYAKAGGLKAAKKEASGQAVKTLAENPDLVKTAVKASV